MLSNPHPRAPPTTHTHTPPKPTLSCSSQRSPWALTAWPRQMARPSPSCPALRQAGHGWAGACTQLIAAEAKVNTAASTMPVDSGEAAQRSGEVVQRAARVRAPVPKLVPAVALAVGTGLGQRRVACGADRVGGQS
jgi:hypothetical protein